MINIRPFKEYDEQSVILLWEICKLTRSKNDPTKDILRKKGYNDELFLVLEKDEEIIGTIMGGYDGHRGIINYLGIHPVFRGYGFGKLLVNKLEEKLWHLGCPQINLLVRADNLEVNHLYESVGYGKADDVHIFRKRLIFDE